jgi:hypothetical protein
VLLLNMVFNVAFGSFLCGQILVLNGNLLFEICFEA